MRFLNLIIFSLIPFILFSQKKDYKLGEIDRSYFEMTSCPWDSSAAAFYILDYGVTRFDATFDIEFTGHVRLKILNSSEFDRADVSLLYNAKKGAPKLKAFTYNLENGEVVATELEKSGIFKENIEGDTYELKFTMPNVKEGSIIEYRYTLDMGSYYRLNTWYFQTSIPVEKSEYHVFIPDWLTYQRLMTPYVPLDFAEIYKESATYGTQSVGVSHHHYEAYNVPAFKDEPYVACDNDVISKLDFELRTTSFPGRLTETILPNTYGELCKKLVEDDYWSKDLQKAPYAKNIMLTLLGGDSGLTDKERAMKLFDYVKSFDKNDETSFNLKKCLDTKSGTDTELNRLLIAMLNEDGLKAEPVRISTRAHGKLDPIYPIVSKFNHTIVKLTLGSETILLDASEKNAQFGVLPKYWINGSGLVINGTEEWIELKPFENNGKSVAGEFEIVDGKLVGKLQVRRKGYDAWEFDKSIDKSGEKEYKEKLEKEMENWVISEHSIDKGDDINTTDENIEIEIEGKVEDLGNVLYLNPVVYGQMLTNPFKKPERKYPVNWGAPESEVYYCKIKIPEGYGVESLPEKFTVALPGNTGSANYSVTVANNDLVIVQRLRMNKSEYTAEEYPYIREFHAQLVAKQAEQIVLKKL